MVDIMIRTYLLATDFLENDEIYQLYYNNVSEFRRGKIDRYKFKKSKCYLTSKTLKT